MKKRNNTPSTTRKYIGYTVATAALALFAACPASAAAEPDSSLEITAGYNIATGDLISGVNSSIDLYGADLTGVYNLTKNHAVTLRFGWATGDKTESYSDGESEDWDGVEAGWYANESEKLEITRFTLMPGYRYTVALNDKFSVYAGANVGIEYQSVSYSYSYSGAAYYGDEIMENEDSESYKDDASSFGLAYSIELGVKYNITENISLLAGYQYSGSSNRVDFDGEKTKQQSYHTFRLGMGVNF